MYVQPVGLLGPAIDARGLFGPERDALLRLLDQLTINGWRSPTLCPGWTVANVAVHMLGDDLGRLARSRDGHAGLGFRAGEDLPRFLDRINDEWVVAGRRLSPTLIIELLGWAGVRVAEFWARQDPDRLTEPVSWASPELAPVWLDAARDFTEYWTHRR